MADQPTRPFESLEWYRDAARRNFQESAPSGFLAFARSLAFLKAHTSAFALGSVLLLLLNFARTPDTIWAGHWIVAWAVLVLIHAVAIGFVWAIQQWDSDEPGAPVRMAPLPNRERSSLNPWAQGPDAVQDAEYRNTATPAEPISEWEGWTHDPETADAPQEERTSWRVASAAAWLQHDEPADQPPVDPADKA